MSTVVQQIYLGNYHEGTGSGRGQYMYMYIHVGRIILGLIESLHLHILVK